MPSRKPAVWITGASSGIGKASAFEFARIGIKVIVSSRRHSMLDLINKELSAEKLSVEVFPCNIESWHNVDQVAKKIHAEYEVDCLVNNAGITSFKLAEENTIKEIDDIIHTNLLGSIYCIKAVLPQMISKKKGTIINILSVAAEQVFTNSSAYAASKAGLLAYTNSLREEVRKHNIKIINIIPGATNTNMWSQDILKKYGEEMMRPDHIARILVSAYLQDKQLVTEKLVIKPLRGDI